MQRLAAILTQDALYPVIAGKRFAYGTAGFRTLGSHLERVCFRAGLLAAIRAKVKGGLAGVMVTASHNPWQDNGLKLIEADGSMLEADWERLAETLVNAENLSETLLEVSKNAGLTDLFEPRGVVYVGQDTRESSKQLT